MKFFTDVLYLDLTNNLIFLEKIFKKTVVYTRLNECHCIFYKNSKKIDYPDVESANRQLPHCKIIPIPIAS